MKGIPVYMYVIIPAAALLLIAAASWSMNPSLGRQCSYLEECMQYAATGGTYDAYFYDSYSSPGGTATIKKAYTVNNNRPSACNDCVQIFTGGYSNSTAICNDGWNCNDVLTQTQIIDVLRNMSVTSAFRLGERRCFYGPVNQTEPFSAIACFDEKNRLVNYGEQGKRPFYGFAIAGYEADLPFGSV